MKSVFEKYNKEELLSLFDSCCSISEILRKLKLSTNGSGSRTALARICKNYGIFDKYRQIAETSRDKIRVSTSRYETGDILIENSPISRGSLKRKIIKEKLLENKCFLCEIKSSWQGKPIVLILDHINGINDDNRVENLRFLCPNCNSQQSTFAGRNNEKEKKCTYCLTLYFGKKKFCSDLCKRKWQDEQNIKQRKFNIEKEKLEKIVWEMTLGDIGKEYGVSGNSISDRCLSLGIALPPNGYFIRKENRA